MPRVLQCYEASSRDKKWMCPLAYSTDGDTLLGHYISVPPESFKCCPRLPLHYFVELVIGEIGCGVGQIGPNSFVVISGFLAHRKRGVALTQKYF